MYNQLTIVDRPLIKLTIGLRDRSIDNLCKSDQPVIELQKIMQRLFTFTNVVFNIVCMILTRNVVSRWRRAAAARPTDKIQMSQRARNLQLRDSHLCIIILRTDLDLQQKSYEQRSYGSNITNCISYYTVLVTIHTKARLVFQCEI